ncbi:MAG: hypothetical protein ACLVML_04720 [Candidatus Gastranaerophilaceae bacterium]
MSHFVTLVNLTLPTVEEDHSANAENAQHIAEIKELLKKEPDSFMLRFALKRLNGMSSTFEREVSCEIEVLMEPFCESTDDPQYLEFEDKTQEINDDYVHGKIDCIRLPGGRIVPYFHNSIHGLFVIRDGKVYQAKAGPLKHEKRTKKAKKMLALQQYPIKKLYKNSTEYAEAYCGYDYYNEYNAYGYLHNPNSFWDWYSIGGRWPFQFLVKETAEHIVGERSWGDDDATREAPEGYIWVCGARKKDIAWDVMKALGIQNAKKTFALLTESFATGECPAGSFWRITEDGIYSFLDQLYVKGETEEEYLRRNGLAPDQRMLPGAYSFLRDGEWISKGDMGWWGISTNEKEHESWLKMMSDYIDSIPEDDVIVGIDCHI